MLQRPMDIGDRSSNLLQIADCSMIKMKNIVSHYDHEVPAQAPGQADQTTCEPFVCSLFILNYSFLIPKPFILEPLHSYPTNENN